MSTPFHPRRHVRQLVYALVSAAAMTLSQSGIAFGYFHIAAANWSNDHINGCGIYHQAACYDNDCTAFLSEALHYGGSYPFVGVSTIAYTSDVHRWYSNWNPTAGKYFYSTTFSFANDLPQFLLWDSPGGIPHATVPGTTLASSSGVGIGDVITYNWDSNNTTDHMSLVVGSGTSTDGYSGDYTNSHTNTRYHAFWTLRTWNTSIQTTTIRPWYIDPAN